MNAKKMMMSVAVWGLMVALAQAVINDTVVISTDVGNNDELYKLDPNIGSIQAQHALGYFDNIGSLVPLPNGNFGLIPIRGPSGNPASASRVILMHTDLFSGPGSIEEGAINNIPGLFNPVKPTPDGGSRGGMSNPQGEIHLEGDYSNFSGGARFNGLNDALPAIDEANDGYWDHWQAGGALSDGSWVIAGNGGTYDSLEVRSRNLPGSRLGRIYGFDHSVTAINVNSADHIGLAYPIPTGFRVSAWHLVVSPPENLSGTANFLVSSLQFVDITSIANGDFVVAANDTGTGEGFLYLLRENTGLNVLEQIDVQGGFGLITKLGVQSDDDILVGARTTIGGDPATNSLFRYNFALDSILSQLDGFASINNIITLPGEVVVPEPTTFVLLGLGGVLTLRRFRRR